MRYLLVTCVLFLFLWLVGYDGFGDKFTELVAGAVAFIVTAIILFIWDIILAPSNIHKSQKEEIRTLKEEIEPYKNRVTVLNYLVANANVLRDLESKLEREEVTPEQFIEKSENIYKDLREQFDKSPYGDHLRYKMSDVSSHNTLAPAMMDIHSRDLVKKLSVDIDLGKRISRLFMYRQNLDGIISHQSRAASSK